MTLLSKYVIIDIEVKIKQKVQEDKIMAKVKMEILGVEVSVHNKREEKLVRIIKSEIERCRRYREENTLGEGTENVIRRNLTRVNEQSTALFYMECMKQTSLAKELEEEFGIYLML